MASNYGIQLWHPIMASNYGIQLWQARETEMRAREAAHRTSLIEVEATRRQVG